MLWFFFFIVVIGVSLALGARYHTVINARIARFLGADEKLPASFELWLSSHKGEYDSIGKAMSAWADAKFGDKYNNLLK